MEYTQCFEDGLKEGRQVVVVPFLNKRQSLEQVVTEVQSILDFGAGYGYSYRGTINLDGLVLLSFELGHDFIRRLTSFVEAFDGEISDKSISE